MSWLEASLYRELKDFSLSVELRLNREITVLFGPSGAGKTMTMRIIAGLVKGSSGKLKIGDKVLLDRRTWVPPRDRKIGFVFQDLALFPHMTVLENVKFALPSREIDSKKEKKALQWLEKVGLVDKKDENTSNLSGGQRQRVALARAMAGEPQLLLLDEPFSALDSPLRRSLRGELKRLHKETKIPIIYVTHNIEDVCALGNRVILIKDGKVSGDITSEELQRENCAKWHSLGWGNILDGTVVKGTGGYSFLWEGGKLSLPASTDREGKAHAFIAPDKIMAVYPDLPLDKVFSGNRIDGTIVEKYTIGNTVHVYGRTENTNWQLQYDRKSYERLNMSEGATVNLTVRPEHISLIYKKGN